MKDGKCFNFMRGSNFVVCLRAEAPAPAPAPATAVPQQHQQQQQYQQQQQQHQPKQKEHENGPRKRSTKSKMPQFPNDRFQKKLGNGHSDMNTGGDGNDPEAIRRMLNEASPELAHLLTQK